MCCWDCFPLDFLLVFLQLIVLSSLEECYLIGDVFFVVPLLIYWLYFVGSI